MSEGENLEVQHRARANQRTDRNEYGYDDGHHPRRLFDSDENLNGSARTGFLVGTANGLKSEKMREYAGAERGPVLAH